MSAPQTTDEAVIAKLRRALALAAMPLEAMLLAGTDRFHTPMVREAITAGAEAAREAFGDE